MSAMIKFRCHYCGTVFEKSRWEIQNQEVRCSCKSVMTEANLVKEQEWDTDPFGYNGGTKKDAYQRKR